MYPDHVVEQRREQLSGVEPITDEAEANTVLTDYTGVLVVNSVCGCASQTLYPAYDQATIDVPARSVFAGVDDEATSAAREFIDAPPSSPAVALFKDGSCAEYISRADIMSEDVAAVTMMIDDAVNAIRDDS